LQTLPKTASTRWTDGRVTLEKLKDYDEDAWDIVLVRLAGIAKEYISKVFSGGANVVTIEDAEDMASLIISKDLYPNIVIFESLDNLEARFRKSLRFDALDLKDKLTALKRGDGKVISMGDPELLADAEALKDLELHPKSAVEDDDAKIVGEKVSVITPAVLAEQNDLRKIIFNCAATLDLDDRKMLYCVYIEKTHAEIAKEMNVGISSVGSRLQRIYQKLRPKIIACMGVKGLKDYGITID
jgi:DNA-directed RNA polymerase specialized sigma24 family protein